MPIARFQLEDGRIARFEVPEGTTPEQAQAMAQSYFQSMAQPPQQPPQQPPSEGSGDWRRTGAQTAGEVGVVRALPFVSEEQRQALGRGVSDVMAGAAQAAMAPAQNLAPSVANYLGLPARGAETENYLRQVLNADPTSGLAKTGQIGAEILLGAPVVRAAGAALGAASPALGQAVRTGGFEIPAAVEGAKGIGLRAVGGGVAGAVGTLPFAPEDVMLAGPIGAVLGPVARVGLGAVRAGRDLFMPTEKRIENELLKATGEKGVNALRSAENMLTTPGYIPSLVERSLAGGLSEADALPMAVLQARLAQSKGAQGVQLAAIQKNMGALRGQLDRIEQEIAQEGTQIAPADLTRLSEIRNSLQRQLAEEGRRLSDEAQTLVGGFRPMQGAAYPEGGAPGEVIQSRAELLQRRMRAEEVQPAYKAAFDAAGSAKIDVSPLAAAARAALGRPLTEFAPESAPSVARVLAKLEPAPVVETRVSTRGRPQRVVTGEAPPTMTLQELDDLRKAINSDISMASRSQAGLTPAQVPELYALHRQIDEAITSSPNLSDEAKTLYGKALETYRLRFKPAFKDNVTGRLLKDSVFGETRILPENTVAAYFKDPTDTRQFLTTFGEDSQARAAFAQGVEDLFRNTLIDPQTMRLKPDAAAGFLTTNADKLQVLEQAGMPILQRLQRAQNEAQRITQGLDEVASLRGGAYGQANPQDIVQSLLNDRSLMADAWKRLSPDGQEAVQASIVRRVTNMLSGADADVGGAVKFLVDHEAPVRQALGRDGFSDLSALVKRAGDVRRVSQEFERSLPIARVEPKVERLVGNFTREELTNLESVAADLARFRTAEGLGAYGRQAPSPASQKLATQAQEESAPMLPSASLNGAANVALRVNRSLGKRMDEKAATELAVLMHQHPERALAAIQRAANRKQEGRLFSGAAGRLTATAAVPAGVSVVKPFAEAISSED